MNKARSFIFEKEAPKRKTMYGRKARLVTLEPNDVVLVRKMIHTVKHKIQSRLADDEYLVASQPKFNIRVCIVQSVSGGKQKSFHRNLFFTFRL